MLAVKRIEIHIEGNSMPCPHSVERAIERCPFLREVCVRDGAEFARHIATRPSRRFIGPVLEEHGDYAATFHLFHGPTGVVPLAAERESCVHDSLVASPPPMTAKSTTASLEQPRRRVTVHPLAASTASISLSGFGFLPGARELFGLGKGRKAKRNPEGSKSSGNPGSQPGPAQPSASQPSPGGGSANFMRITNPLGGLLAMSAKGQLKCPEAIVRMRATVARMKPVRELRPQALPVKLLAVAAFTGLANLPSGAFRVHVEKFSPGWILAVHATIPFIAVIRKAVVMPKWAIAFTIGSAVLGQIMGARLERQRMANYQLRVEASSNSSMGRSGRSEISSSSVPDGIMGWPRAVSLQCREQAYALGIGGLPIEG